MSVPPDHGPSLQRRVALWLSLAIAVAGALAGALSYGLAFFEANELQDAQLEQIARVIAAQPSRPAFGAFVPRDDEDAETHLVVKPLGAGGPVVDRNTDLALPAQLPDGLQTLAHAGVSWRVMVLAADTGERFAVAQRMTVRAEMARDGALVALLPLVALVPVLLLLLRGVLRRAFRPLQSLSRTVDGLGERSLSPLSTRGVPAEVLGLVQAVNRLIARLGASLEQQRRLVSDAAHELRTPVTALMVQAENLAHIELPAAARERMAPLRLGLLRMASLLEQLLGLARLQSAGDAAMVDIDARAVVREVVESLVASAEDKQVDLGCLELAPLRLRGQELKFQAIVRNAIDNAVKYTPAGGTVDVSLLRDGGQLRFVVEDTGPGIAAGERQRVFEPFVRILGTREVGSGLGLAIAASAAEALGGAIRLQARADGGSGLRFEYVQALPDLSPS